MFEFSSKYERFELLDFIGSKQPQSGIIWNKNGGDSIIITTGGRHTKRVGYSDEIQPNGNWVYTGQGEKGDQDPYSFANSLLTNKEKNILLFSTVEPNAIEVRARGHHRKLYQFQGLFEVKSWDFEQQKSGKRKGDNLIKFILEPISEIILKYATHPELVESLVKEPIEILELRKKLVTSNKKSAEPKKSGLVEYNYRSSQIKRYALLRAKGKCEYCEEDAPFKTAKNIPFLEVHHIYSLEDDGPDHPENVAAICPNCHRQAHYGENMNQIKKELGEAIKIKETRIAKG